MYSVIGNDFQSATAAPSAAISTIPHKILRGLMRARSTDGGERALGEEGGERLLDDIAAYRDCRPIRKLLH